jgi:hypothetical protein
MSELAIISFALAVATKTETLTEALVSGIKSSVQYGTGYEKARLSLSLESTTFKSIKRVLFGEAGATANCLFSAFDRQTQIDIINVLRLFKETLECKYRLVDGSPGATGTSSENRSRSPSVLDVTDATVAFGSYHSASLVRRLKWGFGQKDKIESTVRELHGWNEQLLNIIKIQMIENRVDKLKSAQSLQPPHPQRSATSSPAPFLKILMGSSTASEAANLGLEIDLKMSEMSLAGPEQEGLMDFEMKNLDEIAHARILQESDTRRLVQVREKPASPMSKVSWIFLNPPPRNEAKKRLVLIEYKPFVAGNGTTGPSDESKNRVNHLVNILHQEKPERYHCLAASGFFIQDSRFALCFEIPERHNPAYRSLYDLLKSLPEPDLESRFQLARELSTGLWHFHAVGWIHKSFCSANVLCFNDSDCQDAQNALGNPYIFGWEYSRPVSGLSSRVYDRDEMESNVYRHPDQWGLPTTSFRRPHDVYSLGVVLLEIGLWRPIVSLHRNGFSTVQLRTEVQAYILAAAKHQRLRAAMGRRYQAIVIACLEGIAGADQELQSLGLNTFKTEVCYYT